MLCIGHTRPGKVLGRHRKARNDNYLDWMFGRHQGGLQEWIDEFINGCGEKINDVSVGQLAEQLEVTVAAEHLAQVGQHCSPIG